LRSLEGHLHAHEIIQKFETDEQLKIERIMYTRRYSLTLDKRRCVVCELCETVCPREAIHVVKPEDGEQAPPKLEIDVELCQYCGICNAICPFGALELKINGEKTIPVVKFESFPQLIRDIKIDTEKCPVGCTVCMDTCPLKLISQGCRRRRQTRRERRSIPGEGTA